MADLTTQISDIRSASWQERLRFMVNMMKDISRQTEPQSMVATYGQYMEEVAPNDRSVSLSRRDLQHPLVRVTRSDTWEGDIDPWRERNKLPIVDRGLFTELIYKDEPTVIDELKVDPSDPSYPYFEGMGSALAIPLFDNGHALNMVISMRKERRAFSREVLPEQIWTSNLFGRATHNLVLRDELRRAYNAVDRELRVVAEIQQELLPQSLPELKTLDLATHYVTSKWAGGDYYDFLPLGGGRWGILLADVSGHGTPAAVFMAVTHSLAHTAANPADPAAFLQSINEQLCRRYTRDTGRFVTAFYGVYDDTTRTMTFANAGHGPPRVRSSAGVVSPLGRQRSVPLGIDFEESFAVERHTFSPGDTLVLYTDGVTETRDRTDELFGTDRLDKTLAKIDSDPANTIAAILSAVNAFKGEVEQTDDVTLLAARVK